MSSICFFFFRSNLRLFAVECLSIVLNFQLAAMEIAIANSSLEMSASSNNITLSELSPQVILNVAASCPAT